MSTPLEPRYEAARAGESPRQFRYLPDAIAYVGQDDALLCKPVPEPRPWIRRLDGPQDRSSWLMISGKRCGALATCREEVSVLGHESDEHCADHEQWCRDRRAA